MTLMILIVLTSFLDHMFSANYPNVNSDRTVFVRRMILKKVGPKENSTNSSNLSFNFIENYLMKMQTPEKIGFTAGGGRETMLLGGQNVDVELKSTDDVFWEINSFDFLEGKAFTKQNIQSRDNVMIITDKIRDLLYGQGVLVLGKTLEIQHVNRRIIGVVRGCSSVQFDVWGDIYLPYTTTKIDLKDPGLQGGFTATLMAKNESEVGKMKAEFNEIASRIPIPKDAFYNVIEVKAETVFDIAIQGILGKETLHGVVYLILFGFAVLFMSLPAINLVNVNISRMLERSSEIGIRKAFGASSGSLVRQFVVENIIISVLGGIIAVVLAWLFLWFFNHSNIIDHIHLRINWLVGGVAFFLSVVFGLLSGVYPAWRMSKLHVVDALK